MTFITNTKSYWDAVVNWVGAHPFYATIIVAVLVVLLVIAAIR